MNPTMSSDTLDNGCAVRPALPLLLIHPDLQSRLAVDTNCNDIGSTVSAVFSTDIKLPEKKKIIAGIKGKL